MKIGIVGMGVVGSAIAYGFERIGHHVHKHDIKLHTKIWDVLDTELLFVCVATPQNADGSCCTANVEDVVEDLNTLKYHGLVVIKSTVTPGTTDHLHSSSTLRLAVCPEFLREKSSFNDFIEGHDVCIIGAYNDEDYELVKAAHGAIPKSFAKVKPIEAELCKYFTNTFNAARIVFANEFYELCKATGADYQNVKNAVSKRANIGGHYIDCSETFRAFGGSCLPKDTAAMAAFVKRLGLDIKLFDWLLAENERIKAKTNGQ